MENLAKAWLREAGHSLGEFDGYCLDLADEISQWLGKRSIAHTTLWIGPASHGFGWITAHYPRRKYEWTFHVVVRSGGLVHDAWLREPMPLPEYLAKVFPDQSVVVEHRDPAGEVILTEVRREGNRLPSRSR